MGYVPQTVALTLVVNVSDRSILVRAQEARALNVFCPPEEGRETNGPEEVLLE